MTSAVGAPAAGRLYGTFDRVRAVVLERARTAVPFDVTGTPGMRRRSACGTPLLDGPGGMRAGVRPAVPEDLVEVWN
jgi:hypothetical protein